MGSTGDGDAAPARSVAGLRDVREAHPARHRSGSRTANSSQPRRGRDVSIGWEKGMARCATQGGCEDDPGLYFRHVPPGLWVRGRDMVVLALIWVAGTRTTRGSRPWYCRGHRRGPRVVDGIPVAAHPGHPTASTWPDNYPANGRLRDGEASPGRSCHATPRRARHDRSEARPGCGAIGSPCPVRQPAGWITNEGPMPYPWRGGGFHHGLSLPSWQACLGAAPTLTAPQEAPDPRQAQAPARPRDRLQASGLLEAWDLTESQQKSGCPIPPHCVSAVAGVSAPDGIWTSGGNGG